MRYVGGAFERPGPATVWFRLRCPVVLGEQPTPWQRTAAVADFGNGVSAELPFGSSLFINPDLTVSLHRPPTGEWVCLDARTRFGDPGHRRRRVGAVGRGGPHRPVGPEPGRGGGPVTGAAAEVDPSIAELLVARADDDHLGLRFEDRQWTWREVVAASAERASLIRSLAERWAAPHRGTPRQRARVPVLARGGGHGRRRGGGDQPHPHGARRWPATSGAPTAGWW